MLLEDKELAYQIDFGTIDMTALQNAIREKPEYSLFSKIFFLTIYDLLQWQKTKHDWKFLTEIQRQNITTAIAWLLATETSWPASFEHICDLFHISANRLRREILYKMRARPASLVKVLRQEGWLLGENKKL